MKHNFVTFASITVFALTGIIFWETEFSLIVAILIILIYIGLTAYGSFKIQSNYFLKSVSKGTKKGISLTFDDGPDPETTPQVLDILREKKVRATFFVIGKKAEKYPDLLRRINDEGHEIGNHSYSHSNFIAFFSTSKLKADLIRCNEIIENAIGKSPIFFRPPFGVTNPRFGDVLRELQWYSIGWSVRSLDTKADNKYQIINKIISKAKGKDIILLHDNQKVTVESLPDLIEHCIQQGHELVPVSKLIHKEPYDAH